MLLLAYSGITHSEGRCIACARPCAHMHWGPFVWGMHCKKGSGSSCTPKVERVVVEGPGAAGLARHLRPTAHLSPSARLQNQHRPGCAEHCTYTLYLGSSHWCKHAMHAELHGGAASPARARPAHAGGAAAQRQRGPRQADCTCSCMQQWQRPFCAVTALERGPAPESPSVCFGCNILRQSMAATSELLAGWRRAMPPWLRQGRAREKRCRNCCLDSGGGGRARLEAGLVGLEDGELPVGLLLDLVVAARRSTPASHTG